MLGDKAREFLKTLHHSDRIWDYKVVDWEYSELQLVQFAERYHEHKLNERKGEIMSDEELRTLFNKAGKHINLLDKTFAEMKEKGIKICNKCGCEYQKNDRHICSERRKK